MIIDRFTKLSLSILVFSLCLNALNPWLNPTLANAEVDDTEVKNAMKIIAQGINRIAGVYEKQEQRAQRAEQRAQRAEQRAQRLEQQALRAEQRILLDRAELSRAAQEQEIKELAKEAEYE